MFDFGGKPLDSLKVFKYVLTGTTGYGMKLGTVEQFTRTCFLGGTLALPQTAKVTNSMGTLADLPVTWSNTTAVNMSAPGVYTVSGTVGGNVGDLKVTNAPTSCTVTVLRENKLSNPGFEDGNTGCSAAGKEMESRPGTAREITPMTGEYFLHYYNRAAFTASAEHAPVTLEPGTCEFSLYTHGTDATGKIYVKDGETELGSVEYAVARSSYSCGSSGNFNALLQMECLTHTQAHIWSHRI